MTVTQEQLAVEVEDTGQRDKRSQLPLWRISGTFTLTTPLHIGTGRDEVIALDDYNGAQPQDRTVVTVVRDRNGHPCVPGSSLKGALNELARRGAMDNTARCRLFGDEPTDNETTPAQLEFSYLYLDGQPPATSKLPNFGVTDHEHVANLPHVARNRQRGTAEDGLLFVEQVVPPGCKFRFNCIGRTSGGIDWKQEVAALLGLLNCAGSSDSPLRLGAGKSADNGRVTWALTEVRCVESLEPLWKALSKNNAKGKIDLWTDAYAPKKEITAANGRASDFDWLNLSGLSLNFHTPFLVYQRQKKRASASTPDGAPRTNDAGTGALPSSSLHGALRTQAERILRTLGEETPKGYRVPAVHDIGAARARLDLASVLFGAPGWRSVVRCSDFLLTAQAGPPFPHEMVAIDRLTGSGKDSAKFNIKVFDCPTLRGDIYIDLRRLLLLTTPTNQNDVLRALGLLAHVMRDLDEGDIPLGYGAAKGYGISNSDVVSELRAAISRAGIGSLDTALCAFSASLAPASVASATLQACADPPPLAPAAAAPVPATEIFHNPYVFIPFGRSRPGDHRLPWDPYSELAEVGDSRHRHDRYDSAVFHGRLLCKLKTASPIFIGAGDLETTAGQPKSKDNFKLAGAIALPATSLRGMVSSLHESITRSALRVMHNRGYSLRQQSGGTAVNAYASSAIGRIHACPGADNTEQWSVEPLTLPTLSQSNNYRIDGAFGLCFPDDDDGVKRAYHKVLLEPRCMDAQPQSHYVAEKNQNFDSERGHGYWYMPLQPLNIGRDLHVEPGNNARFKGVKIQGVWHETAFVIGQRPVPSFAWPISEAEYLGLSAEERGKYPYVRGFIRAMGFPDRDMPPATVRKYELFIPFPTMLDEFVSHTLTCSPACVERFESLAVERFDSQTNDPPDNAYHLLPYAPIGRSRSHRSLRPEAGDLVFFKPEIRKLADGSIQAFVAEISYSSIWRARLETVDAAGQIKPYHANFGLPDQRFAPLGSAARADRRLSPSELLFGCVQLEQDNQELAGTPEDSRSVMAFASKVRLGHARAVNGATRMLEATTLKILSSPKPPSPSMYFHPLDGARNAYVSKPALVQQPDTFRFKGRKVYLHALRRAGKVLPLDANGYTNGGRLIPPWETSNPGRDAKQKVKVTPIDKGNEFIFEVDFANLSQAELESLCASLMPHPSFEHKIGMGKPIGLGSVKVDVVGMYLVDRAARYRKATFVPGARYAQVWRGADFPTNLPTHLAREQATPSTITTATPAALAHAQMSTLKTADLAAYKAIVLSGNPESVISPVHYPQVAGQGIEDKTFTWFVKNDAQGWIGVQQGLKLFTDGSASLPTLSRVARVKPERQR